MKHLLLFFLVSLCLLSNAQQINEKPLYILVDSTIYQRLDTNIVSQILILDEKDSYNVIVKRFFPISDKELEEILKEFFKPEPRKI